MQTVKEIFEGLKNYNGSFAALAARRGCTRQWVRMVLTEKGTDTDLVLEAAKLFHELVLADQDKMRRAADYVTQAQKVLAEKGKRTATEKYNYKNLAVAEAAA